CTTSYSNYVGAMDYW
nr:immunoglobulin heavy chain junction region [Mus musculus]MBK4198378.1 immunoglobulin heavy chain junction region [Mus musculus]